MMLLTEYNEIIELFFFTLVFLSKNIYFWSPLEAETIFIAFNLKNEIKDSMYKF